MAQWSSSAQDDDAVAVVSEEPPGYNNKSLEWVKGVMEKLGEEEGGGAGGGGGGQCLGRRMGTFESVEAEGRQFGREVRGRLLFGVPRVEGQEVPTRVLFDNRDVMPVLVVKKKKKKKEEEKKSGSAENEVAELQLQTTSTSPVPPTTTANSASDEEKGKQKESTAEIPETEPESNPDDLPLQ